MNSAGFGEVYLDLTRMTYSGCRPFSEDEITRILDACQGRYRARNVALILMGAYCGFRIKETLSIRIKDIWDGTEIAREVTVSRAFMKGKKRARSMPLHTKVRDALLALLQSSRMTHPLFFDWPLFHSQGRPTTLCTRQAYDIILSAAASAGLDLNRVGTHSLRKAFACRLYRSPLINRDMCLMARALGHSNYSNTLRYLEFADELEAAILA